MSDLAALRADDFDPLVGSEFRVLTDDLPPEAAGPIRLTQVQRRDRRSGERDVFVLLFEGESEACLPQLMHRLEHDTLGELPIFLVPFGRTPSAWQYEAIFA
jgi:hypothetical protein